MMGQYLMDLKNGPTINNLLWNMKNSFEFSYHKHHQQLHPLVLPQQTSDQVLDLSAKRRDSTETRKTTSPSSFEEGSPDLRRTSPGAEEHMIHHHINIPKPQFTPEHSVQYRYNFEPSSPSTNIINSTALRSPQDIYSRSPVSSKQAHVSPQPDQKPFHQIRPTHHNEDSSDTPATANISSSCSTASSQKSPSSSNGGSMMVIGRDGKLSRPFKAYPRDPLSLAAAGSILDAASAEKYSVFRKRMFAEIHAANGGNPVVNNPKMRRTNTKSTSHETNNNEPEFEKIQQSLSSPSSGNDKDEAYFERRKKNNAAAKKSRDRRRIKEDEIAIRAAFLERENIELKYELASARKQLAMFSSTLTSS